MKQLRDFEVSELRNYVDWRVRNHTYVKGPHLTFLQLIESGDTSTLLMYAQEQVPISHHFLIGLGKLANNLINAGIEKSFLDTRIVELAYNVVFNITEELRDPQAKKSHVALLGDYQKRLLQMAGEAAIGPKIKFTKSRITENYRIAMQRGMINPITGLLYLGVMETWMGPEYDFLEQASTKARVPKESQVYFDANRDADGGRADTTIGHANLSLNAAIQLAKINPKWDISKEKIDRVIDTSCSDRSKFWDQFTK